MICAARWSGVADMAAHGNGSCSQVTGCRIPAARQLCQRDEPDGDWNELRSQVQRPGNMGTAFVMSHAGRKGSRPIGCKKRNLWQRSGTEILMWTCLYTNPITRFQSLFVSLGPLRRPKLTSYRILISEVWNLRVARFANMKTRAEFLGHPIHQMVIALPLGLLATAAAFDAISVATRNRRLAGAGYYMQSAGLITALGAAVPGAMDWWDIPRNTRAKNIGLLHGIGNLAVTGLYGASWWLRRRRPNRVTRTGLALSTSGALLALVTGWLGGELVDQLGIGVHENANVDAPSSLARESLRRGVALQPDESVTRREAI